MKLVTLSSIAAALLVPGVSAWAEPVKPVPLDYLPALKGDYFPLDSKAVGQRYHIYVRLPEGYDPAAPRNYPTIYLLDGDSTFPILAGGHLFLTYDDKLPEAIVVGIAYGSFASPVNRREVDFGEGAAKFQDFLGTELIPEIERRFRTDPQRRILVGQSFGGTFVLFSAFTGPELFWGRISSNPSFRMHQELLNRGPAAGRASSNRCLIVVSGTANNPQGRQGVVDLTQRLQGRPLPWKFDRIDIPGGTHAADISNAYRLGLRSLFSPAAK